jgi:phage terminase small subunit
MTKRDQRFGDGSAYAAGPSAVEEVAERAKRLGISAERILQEFARIGFANIGDIVEWDDKGIRVKPSADLSEDQLAAIVEVVASASSGKIYRVRMHDKKPVLGAMGRHLGMFKPAENESEQTEDEGEEAREFLLQELDRLVAEVAAGEEDSEAPQSDPEAAR